MNYKFIARFLSLPLCFVHPIWKWMLFRTWSSSAISRLYSIMSSINSSYHLRIQGKHNGNGALWIKSWFMWTRRKGVSQLSPWMDDPINIKNIVTALFYCFRSLKMTEINKFEIALEKCWFLWFMFQDSSHDLQSRFQDNQTRALSPISLILNRVFCVKKVPPTNKNTLRMRIAHTKSWNSQRPYFSVWISW